MYSDFFLRDIQSVNCADPKSWVSERYLVVNCLRFIPPVGSTWLQHVAISQSLALLVVKV